MKIRFYTPAYAVTLLLSAFLLFAVQPMFSKMILPLLGGTPQVWNTAMMFFQVTLLAGYAYAHATSRYLSIRVQSTVQIVLLLVFMIVLPITVPESWIPSVDQDPTLWQLSLMIMTVGGPFFVLSASAPMLQHWFAGSDHPHADNPYFLYGASNLGSISALLAYPVIIEPLLNIPAQSQAWSMGYYALIACTLICVLIIGKNKKHVVPTNTPPDQTEVSINWTRRLTWLVLAFIPSSLMLGVTTFITTDVASVPLLWVLPLALYVGTFIIVFARKPLLSRNHILSAHALMMIGMIALSILMPERKLWIVIFHFLLFFSAALSCHTELAALKPRTSHLTEFYLFMSLGGALGGVLNSLIAPRFFVIPLEYAVILAAACFMRFAAGRASEFEVKPGLARLHKISFIVAIASITGAFVFEQGWIEGTLTLLFALSMTMILDTRLLFAVAMSFAVLFNPPGHVWGQEFFEHVLYQDRNFFGVIRVVDLENKQRMLLHGTTNHGAQSQDPDYKLTPISYYGPQSPLSDVFRHFDRQRGAQNIAVLGLGIGTVACYPHNGRQFEFFEIDQNVIDVAENPEYFTFLSDCGSPYSITLGDARLKIAEKDDHTFDLVIADAFSSDNIPVHLLTKDAVELYFQKIKPDGLIVFNVSNNYLDIEPVLARIADDLGVYAYASLSNGGTLEGTDISYFPAHFVALTRNESRIKALEEMSWTPAVMYEHTKLWTDQYSNIVSVLGNKAGKERYIKVKEAQESDDSKEAIVIPSVER